MPRPRSSRDWTITLAEGVPSARVLPALRRAGLEVLDVLDAIGVITGRAPASVGAALRRIPGVADVASTVSHDVGPPDADPS